MAAVQRISPAPAFTEIRAAAPGAFAPACTPYTPPSSRWRLLSILFPTISVEGDAGLTPASPINPFCRPVCAEMANPIFRGRHKQSADYSGRQGILATGSAGTSSLQDAGSGALFAGVFSRSSRKMLEWMICRLGGAPEKHRRSWSVFFGGFRGLKKRNNHHTPPLRFGIERPLILEQWLALSIKGRGVSPDIAPRG